MSWIFTTLKPNKTDIWQVDNILYVDPILQEII